jgi:hypothetical protein
MTFETDLREALHEHATPINASSELRAVDYHPRTRRARPSLAIGGGIATFATAGIAAALLLAGGASNALAGWTATPTTPTASQLAAAQTYCAARMPNAGLPLQLAEERGTFTFEVYANDRAANFCITGPASFVNASGFSASAPLDVPSGNLDLWTENTSTYDGDTYGFVIAIAADDVTAATLTLDDGTQVTATVQSGWAVAWWPGSHEISSAQLTTSTGTQTQTFPSSPCGQTTNCIGGPHGSPDG